ncbi:unnamed protein product [Polarella glacialis]|uniref:Phospholipid/glycerol acyltransferase domain-containing protein n=1 Tax=Polarella glacialis TaxID=89957 RepID=A0A813DBT1_POLGL|nr:unnamed protein product [Polarella glacialis]|mmetsp:Transcript_73156/g.117983  ORF Transcript_73156/g.117983 Transcript_73156/m.117983 type:complete len:311 (-) Transcript_73156:123-1055(-)
MGAMLGGLCQASYGVCMMVNMVCAAGMMKLIGLLPLSKNLSQGLALMLTQAAWSFAIFCAPWMRCTSDDQTADEWALIQQKMAEVDAEVAAGKSDARPLMILANHMCFFDTLLSVAKMPSRVLWRCRTYMDASLFNLPILSTMCRSIGHYPVYFSSKTDGVFTVDKEKNEIEDKKVNLHLNSGGWLCFFPEGQMNSEPDTLLPFRFGGMKKALQFDARLVAFVASGSTSVWPKKCKIGGLPGSVKYSMRIIAPDGCKAFLAELRTQKDLPEEDKKMEDHELLAKHARLRMQAQYDELKQALAGGKSKKVD